MHRTTIRTRAIGVVALLCAALALFTSVPGRPAAAQTDAGAEATLTEIASCLKDTNRLLVMLLVDESGSLRTTDPANERVTAARLALQAFTALTQDPPAGGNAPSVEVLVAGFSSSFNELVPWTPLNARSVRQVELAVDGFATRNSGIDTDFPTALIGAQRRMAERTQEITDGGVAAPCKAILLFTDGRYDIQTGNTPARRAAPDSKEYAPNLSVLDPRNDQAIEEAGRTFLCQEDGLADRLRADRATLVTLALSAQLTVADQAFLRALATGEYEGITCGSRRGARFGAYLASATLEQLAPLFNQVVSTIGGGSRLPGQTRPGECATSPCIRGTRSFTLDEVMNRFTATLRTGADAIRAELTAPSEASALILEPGVDGEEEYGGTTIAWTWVGEDTVTVRSSLPADDLEWVGDWKIEFVDVTGLADDARPDAFIDVFGAWTPQLANRVRFVRGEDTRLAVEVVDTAGERVSRRRLDDAGYRIAGSVVDRGTGTTTALDLSDTDESGLITTRFATPADLASEQLDVRLRLTIGTSDPDVRLAATERYTLDVEPPDIYPSLVTVELELSSVRGLEAAEGVIEIVGGRDRAGCVWIGVPVFDSFPASAEGFATTIAPNSTEARCVEVTSRATVEFEVRVEPRAIGEGTAAGTIPVFLSAVDEGDAPEVLEVSLPITFDMSPPINEARRLGLFAVILLAGILGPIVAVALLNVALARFEPAADALVARVPVQVERSFSRIMRVFAQASDHPAGRAIRRLGPGGETDELTLSLAEFERLRTGAERSRTVEWDDLLFQAEAPRNPFGTPFGTVLSRSPIVAGNVATPINRDARIPLALPGTWVFVLRDLGAGDAESWIAGDLVIVLAESDAEAQLPRVLAAVDAQLPTLANDLADEVRDGQ
ncbi:MAG TPA: vWA domain-containing protein [Acidimicrobiia bacterium]|nr:vWA domain-containing protein [Acidimicrobiia bacterium]